MHHVDLSTIRLDSGSHTEAQAKKGQACLLEWTAIFAGVDFGDHPECTSPVLGAFGRTLNDGLDAASRQRLVPFIPRLVGTAGGPEADEVRAWMATDWLVRVFTPTWLRKAGLTARAEDLANLPEITSTELARAALATIEAARTDADAAGAAAGAAARDAAWAAAGAAGAAARAAAMDAAWAAAWDAARAAGAAARDAATDAWAAAWDAARDAWAAAWDAGAAARDAGAARAAWDAARDAAGAAGAAARDAAWAAAGAAGAARAAAGAAAWDAYQNAKGDKWDSAYEAARPIMDAALAETKAELLDSVLELFGRMCDYRTPVAA